MAAILSVYRSASPAVADQPHQRLLDRLDAAPRRRARFGLRRSFQRHRPAGDAASVFARFLASPAAVALIAARRLPEESIEAEGPYDRTCRSSRSRRRSSAAPRSSARAPSTGCGSRTTRCCRSSRSSPRRRPRRRRRAGGRRAECAAHYIERIQANQHTPTTGGSRSASSATRPEGWSTRARTSRSRTGLPRRPGRLVHAADPGSDDRPGMARDRLKRVGANRWPGRRRNGNGPRTRSAARCSSTRPAEMEASASSRYGVGAAMPGLARGGHCRGCSRDSWR